jgi:hypothetical protein
MDEFEMVTEILARVRRTETRLTKLGIQLGVDLTDQKVRIALTNESPPFVEVSGLDVSLQDILAFCGKRGIMGVVTVTYRNRLLGNVLPLIEKENV